jgi:hypothetical protein
MGGIIAVGIMTVGLMRVGKHVDERPSTAPPLSGNQMTRKVTSKT